MIRSDTLRLKYKHVYNLKQLQSFNESCEREIKRMTEEIEKIKSFQLNLHEQAQIITQTDFHYVVVLMRRRNFTDNKIHFYVRTEERPTIERKSIDGEAIYGILHDQKDFKGKERGEAIRYAHELSEHYGCVIEQYGFNAWV